jgi:exodeoxyribonuclease V beta subunit
VSAPPVLDPVRVPLAGTLLVEASAGTGKTWTIGALLLRFLVEEGLALPELLVLTFTEAATADLRERLRLRLEEARAALESGEGALPDAFLEALRLRLEDEGRWDRALCLARVRAALACFDEASIFTIHGFCQRVLAERPAALGLPSRMELGERAAAALRDAVLDELRRLWDRLGPLALDWLWAKRLLDPAVWIPLARLGDTHPDAEVEVSDSPSLEAVQARLTQLETAYQKAGDRALHELRDTGTATLAQLIDAAPLNRNSYRPAKVRAELDGALAWLELGAPLSGGEKALKYATGALAAKVNNNGQAPRHCSFDLLQELADAQRGLLAACADLLEGIQCEALKKWPGLARRLRLERRQLAFGDLLTQVRDGLAAEGGKELAVLLRQRWRAALVDEFQDTDPVQAEIFRRIFGEGRLPLVLVGDPKQAIYSFRGADLHAYLAAARQADRLCGLETNWRSDGALIRAVNRLFAAERFPAGRGAFLIPGVAARPVRPSGSAAERTLVLDGRERPALRVLQAPADGLTKGQAERLVLGHLARFLSDLLRGDGRSGWRSAAGGGLEPVRGSDVAVLVRTNGQGERVVAALAEEGVASVWSGQSSVWKSGEAGELLRLLHALARPADTGAARALLAGPLALALGSAPAEALVSVGLLERLQVDLLAASREARRTGLATAAWRLLEAWGVPEALLGLRRGERRLVNWMHLLELLRAEEAGGWSEPDELALRLRLRADEERPRGEAELRLESEENLVRVLTQHKCKGLEFGLVACPFLWDGGRADPGFGAALLHEGGRARLSPYSPARPLGEAERAEAADERLAEALRLAYVALTRAPHHALVYSLMPGAGSAKVPGALDWLLLPERPGARPPGLKASWDKLHGNGAGAQLLSWQTLAGECGGALAVEELAAPEPRAARTAAPRDPAGAEAPARPFPGRIAQGERLSSFTSLMTGAHADLRLDEWFGPEEDGREGGDGPGETEAAAGGGDWRAGFPRGARAGTCLHRLLERVDFQPVHDAAHLTDLCRRELRAHGLDPHLAAGTASWLREVLLAPLGDDGFRLADLEPGDFARELEFHLAVAPLRGGELAALLRRHGLGALAPAAAERGLPAGFLKGYVDLCHVHAGRWWVVDWKSNRLGASAACYTRPAMAEEMARSGYLLQALLYLLALHRQLGRLLPDYDPERHLGGLRYVFLRGVQPDAPGQGVFLERPPAGLIRELDHLLEAPCR